MRISDWSSDVCSSDLYVRHAVVGRGERRAQLLQRVGAEGRHQQQATGTKHAAEAGERGGQVVDPLQAQVAGQHVAAAIRQWQAASGGGGRTEERRGGKEGGGKRRFRGEGVNSKKK